MIPKAIQRNVESNLGEVEVSQFKVAINSKTFSILTDNLYENKIQSLLRELSSNAYDSHVEAGKADVPFKVILPTFLSPDFKIRDYGTGMSHDTVMHLYVELFNTTKAGSNDFTGYIGIGSKVPFAYVNTFTVTAFDEGSKRVYVVALNEQDIPEISSLGTFESDEPVGVEIALSARPEDEYKFAKEAARVFAAYDVKPVCNLDIPEPTVIMEGDGWKVIDREFSGFGDTLGRVYFQQGSVLYPYSPNRYYSYQRQRRNGLFIINMPIGSLEVSSSREALSLDDDTTEAIEAKIKSAEEEAFAIANKEITDAPSWREAVVTYKKYNGMLHSEDHRLISHRFEKEPPLTTANFTLELDADKVRSYSSYYTRKSEVLAPNKNGKITIVAPVDPSNNNVRFVIDRGYETPIKRRMMRVNDHLGGTNSYFIENPSNEDLKKICRFFGLTHQTLISVHSTPDHGPPERADTSGEVRGVYTMDNYRFTGPAMPDEYIWIAIEGKRSTDSDRMTVDAGSGNISGRDFKNVIRRMMTSGLIPKHRQVFFVTKTVAKKLPAEFSFASFWQNVLDKDKMEVYDKGYKLRKHIEGEFKFPAEWLNKHYPVASQDKLALVDIHQLLEGYSSDQIAKRDAILAANKKEAEKLGEKYPLLRRITSNNSDAINNYIKMCENTDKETI